MSSIQEQKNTETDSDSPKLQKNAVQVRQGLQLALPFLQKGFQFALSLLQSPWCKQHNLTVGRVAMLAAMFALLIGLVLMPVGMSHQYNSRLPIIGSMESLAVDYAGQTSLRAGAAFGVCKLVGALINVAKSVEISTVIASVEPGALLEIISSTIDRFSEIFLLVMGIGMTAKMLTSIGTWLCFKICLPFSLIFGLIHIFGSIHLPEGKDRFLWSRPLATFFFKCGLLAWLFLPLTAVVNNYVAANALDSRWNELAAEMPKENDKILNFSFDELKEEQPAASEQNSPPANSPAANSSTGDEAAAATNRSVEAEGWTDSGFSMAGSLKSVSETTSVLQRIGDSLKKLGQLPANLLDKVKDKIREITDYADRLIDRLMEMIVLFGLTTLVIPLTSFLMLKGMLRSLTAESKKAIPQEAWTTMKQMPKDLKETFKQQQEFIDQVQSLMAGGQKGNPRSAGSLPEKNQTSIPPKTPAAEKE